MAKGKNLQNRRNERSINFLMNNFNLYGIPEKIKSDNGGPLSQKSIENFAKAEI